MAQARGVTNCKLKVIPSMRLQTVTAVELTLVIRAMEMPLVQVLLLVTGELSSYINEIF